jgi:hypothetical protein
MHHFDLKRKAKKEIMECSYLPGIVDFEYYVWLIKSSFITKDENKACSLTRTKVQQQQQQQQISSGLFNHVCFHFMFQILDC